MGARQHRASRQQLAYLAARMMAEDGYPDPASARRKLAKQMGIRNDRDLPDDGEITLALRSFQWLYQCEEQTEVLTRLRETAVEAMELLKPYDPWLVGSVLNGTASEYSDIQLQLYTDRGKDLEMFLLGQSIPCRFRERRAVLGGRVSQIPVVDMDFPGGHVEASVFSEQDVRVGAKSQGANVIPHRARLEKVKALLKA
jgi:hypothetical protein